MLELIMVYSFLSILIIILSGYRLMFGDSYVMKKRLGEIGMNNNNTAENEELSRPFNNRILQPFKEGLAKRILQFTPKEFVTNYENSVIRAGMPFSFGVNEWLMLQAFMIFVVPSVSIAFGIIFQLETIRVVSITLLEVIFGLAIPKLILTAKTQERQKDIMKALPDTLDLITVSVEAGLGFDAALGKVVEKMPGPLAKEFERVLQEMKMGKTRRDALKSMGSRINIVDFTTFVASIIQADQLGVSIGTVLRVQSEQMRMKRRQRAQEKAMKAPVKMLIPMVLFIFPTIFTVILGPMVIRMIETFKK